MPTTGEGAGGRRLALVVATGSYADPALAKLKAPGRDAADLAGVLGDAAIGGFEVETVLDAPAESLRRQIAHFCHGVGARDLALVYLSCHGVLDDRGRLYYAAADTDRTLLSATAVPAGWLNEQLEDCRSRRQILVLDCCHSGAFAKGAKGEGALALRDRFEGRGRVVMTGSRGTEYSFEHDDAVGESVSSVFTKALVEGLRSGEADRDGDGLVTVDELYDHAYDAVRAKEARQTPTLWTYGVEGDLLVAHSPRGAVIEPTPLPGDLVALLESARPRVREGAVAELAELLTGPDQGRALTAREALERVAAGDVPAVAAAARKALDAGGPARTKDPPPPLPPPPPQPPPPRPEPEEPHGRRRLVAIGAAAAAIAALGLFALLAGGSSQSGPETFQVGGSPRGVAVGGGAWISRHDDAGVLRIDSGSNREEIHVGSDPGKVAVGEDSVWVSYEEGQSLARVDPDTREVTRRLDFSGSCGGCTVTELAIVDDRLWVSSADGHTIATYDPQTGDEDDETGEFGPLNNFEGHFALDRKSVWVVGEDESGRANSLLTRVDVGSQEEQVELRERGYFSGIAYGHGTVWIANSDRNIVTAFDRNSGTTVDVKVASGIYADDIAYAGDVVLVWDPVRGILTRIDTETKKLLDRKPVKGFTQESELNEIASDLAVGDEFAWVTDPAKGVVHKLEY